MNQNDFDLPLCQKTCLSRTVQGGRAGMWRLGAKERLSFHAPECIKPHTPATRRPSTTCKTSSISLPSPSRPAALTLTWTRTQ